MAGPAKMPDATAPSATDASGPPVSRRVVEHGLLLAAPIVVVIVLLLWTAVLPGLYPASPMRWTAEIPTCTRSGETVPWVSFQFPLWASVRVRWAATGDIAFEGWGISSWDRYAPEINQVGTSGNASFVSNADTMVFDPLAFPLNSSCQKISVTIVATYSA